MGLLRIATSLRLIVYFTSEMFSVRQMIRKTKFHEQRVLQQVLVSVTSARSVTTGSRLSNEQYRAAFESNGFKLSKVDKWEAPFNI